MSRWTSASVHRGICALLVDRLLRLGLVCWLRLFCFPPRKFSETLRSAAESGRFLRRMRFAAAAIWVWLRMSVISRSMFARLP